MLYKALGFAVWKGGKWYLRRKLPARPVLFGGLLALVLAAVGAVAVGRSGSSE